MRKIMMSLLTLTFILDTSSVSFANHHRKTVTKNHLRKHVKRNSHQKRTLVLSNNENADVYNIRLRNVHVTATPIALSSSNYVPGMPHPNPNTEQAASFVDPKQARDNSSVAFNTVFGQVDWPTVSKNMYLKHGKLYSAYHGYELELTLDPRLQDASNRYLNSLRIINGATAIIEPKSGRILALAQTGGNRNASVSVSSKAPAASLFKIITASAAIEKQDLSPDDEIHFRGGCGTLHDNNWIANPERDTQKLTFAMAFGSSCNTAFARLAVYDAGFLTLKEYAEKFMFNHPIPSDLKIQTSQFLIPDIKTATTQELAEAGAGFGATKLGPIHSALLSATVKNNGVMMAPYLVEAAYDKEGKQVYKAKPLQIGQIIAPKTAEKIETLMLETVAHGTSRRMFLRKGTRYERDDIGGKTGTLLDLENRDVLYTWFSGVAQLNSPHSIAIGTVVASQQNYVVRASSVAQTTLAEFLKIEKAKSE